MLFSALLIATAAQAPPSPIELGRVRFLRSIDQGLARASAEERVVFALFQEVPGCSTCTTFGRGPLSSPLFVEAIETLFVPVAIHNNAGGDDARALERFKEPAWNNPVVRFLDPLGADVIARRDGIWTGAALAARMTAALAAGKQEVPLWWRLAELDARAQELPRAVFAMHCFWVGQARLGALEGVADARPAFLDGEEVVEVRYDPARMPLAELVRAAVQAEVATRIWVESAADLEAAGAASKVSAARLATKPEPAPDSDDLRSLKASAWARADLTRSQAVWLNAALASNPAASPLGLSPRQRQSSAK